MKEYCIERAPVGRGTDAAVPLCGDSSVEPWSVANPLSIDTCPWPDGGTALSATLRACYDDEALYLQYRVTDDHVLATRRNLNGPVWKDSCVELFVSPHADRPHYLNFEANCLGDFLLGYGPDREHRRLVSQRVADAIQVETSIPGLEAISSATPEEWWLVAELPFEALGAFVGKDVSPTTDATWRANAYCCRGEPSPRFVAWNPIDAPAPNFHRPTNFGQFMFR